MSLDDYEKHVLQKIRVATAIAVLRSKPKNLSTEEYIEKLRKNIVSMDYDSDLTVCSEDFEIDCDDVISDLKYNDNKNKNGTTIIDDHNNTDVILKKNSQASYDDHRNYKDYVSNSEIHKDNGIEHNDSLKTRTIACILENDDVDKDKPRNVVNYIEILQELKQVDTMAQDKYNNHSQQRFSNSQTHVEEDSDATFCESLPTQNTLEETEIYCLNDFTPFYTHYSQSQAQKIVIGAKLIHKNQLNQNHSNPFEYIQNAQNSESINLNQIDTNNINNPKLNKDDNEINLCADNKNNQINIRNDRITEPLNDVISYSNTANLYDNDGNSNSQIIDTKSLHNIGNDNYNNFNYTKAGNHDRNTEINANDITHFIVDSTNNVIDASMNADVKDANNIKNYRANKNDAEDTHTQSEVANGTNAEIIVNEDISNDSDLGDSQREIVPFKVIEELNKIKNYLKKKQDRRTSCDTNSDSGFRSSSQRSSRNSFLLSSTLVNQSAHSLLTYITTCSLSAGTYDITKEVSRALGSLIDKLHEDELYPSFLDVLLDTITLLLNRIYEEDGYNDVLISKDEKVQRVLFLNKSMHIQKYTIDKITDILATIDTEANEVVHIAKLENLSYLFHILEIILSKHKIDHNSQSQDSQETVLKKSSITDIWRKKWNLTKEVVVENVEKKCALTKCGEVLNKMIVNCMEEYSLISFVALKCFNLLQP